MIRGMNHQDLVFRASLLSILDLLLPSQTWLCPSSYDTLVCLDPCAELVSKIPALPRESPHSHTSSTRVSR